MSVLGAVNEKQKLKSPDKGVAKEKITPKKHSTPKKSSSIVNGPEVIRTFFRDWILYWWPSP